MLNIKEIKEMIQLMNENHLTELEIEKEDMKIRLKKGASGIIEASPVETLAQAPKAPAAVTPIAVPAAPKTIIRSPMVGTFYAAPAPDAPPFVQPGTQIEVGKVICVIEAMKLMNEIKAELRGKIAEVLVNNGDPVEFGQPLFSLE